MAAGRFGRRLTTTLGTDPEDRIAALVDAHGAALLRVARHHSLCVDDANDAYQRALEIYLRRLDTVDPATEGAWMKVVVRHEAMAVRRMRSGSVSGEELDFDARVDDAIPQLEERLAQAERSARSAEVLRRLKPDEATALLLKAEGHSYVEIGERQGWSYTKVNRAIAEGRRRFLKTYAELESGDGCQAYRPGLAELARGSASAETLLELRPHLRHCPACRATVRELRGGRRRVAAWLPLPAFLGAAKASLDYERNIAELGGQAVPPPVALGRWGELKLHVQHLVQRLGGSDVGASVQVAASSGGGRGLSVAAVLGICVSSVGAGTYCVATLIPDPPPIVRKVEKPKQKKRKPAAERPQAVERSPVRVAEPRAPLATATPAAKPERRKRQPSAKPGSTARKPASRRHESSPPPAPPVPGQQELGFEQSAAASGGSSSSHSPQPAAAPPTGGEEFAP